MDRIRSNKIAQIFFLLAAGWMLGYFHHYFASEQDVMELEAQVETLEINIVDAQAMANTVKQVNVKTTAYSNDNASINVKRWRDKRTATNKFVRRGMVAADWRVFPPGTQLYIPGYGEAVVEDRGGAVKGYHLDLFVDSAKEAREWGVKKMKVYVIKKGRTS